MIDKKFINTLRGKYLEKNIQRRQIISSSAIILNNSKKAIFALHRQEFKPAEIKIKEAEEIIKKIEKKFTPNRVRREGSYSAALEEYTEAKLFLQFLKTGKITRIKEINLPEDSYIGGVCDLSGELVRLATNEAINKNFKEVKRVKVIINNILNELVDFDITGYLRTKYDQARGNLKKIEQMDYEISLKKLD